MLTDGFAFGITLLVALTGRGAVGLLDECDEALEADTAEGIAAADAGWSAAQAEEVARLVVGLAYERKRKRMPLAEALPRLEALAEAAEAEIPSLAGAAAAEPDGEERQCDLCYDAPRSVRFACGHALYCETCAPRVLERDTKCPTCRQPALPIAAAGAHVAAQSTFVYQPPARAVHPQPANAAAAAGRRGGREGWARGAWQLWAESLKIDEPRAHSGLNGREA